MTKTPFLDASPKPPKKPSGIEITNAHGQLMTKKIRPRYNHSLKLPYNSEGMTTKSNAINTTIGVYTFANFVIKRSVLPLCVKAFSINSTILYVVDSSYIFVTLILSKPDTLMTPDVTESFGPTCRYLLSPVMFLASISEKPSMTTPSNGINSPGLTCII